MSKWAKRRMGDHLRTCGSCRAELCRLQEEIVTIFEAHVEVFEPSLPPPPQPWPRLEPRLARAAQARRAPY
jgi:hypothetical protein